MHYTEKTNRVAVTTAIKKPPDVLSVRRIKIQPFYRRSRSRCMYKPPAKVVPYIHLCGNWLQEADFKPCEEVTVTVMKGTLVIKKEKR
ncbi:SymE family type I addiction module toxin [Flavobacterium collinsii]|jgi:hypothetical protein|uniref:SymE family type I addiction module toxin n=1 Tax=Flavobacterium collinsii TaxID=1114861 RepID=UPI003757613B